MARKVFVELTKPRAESGGRFLPRLILAFGRLASIELEPEQPARREREQEWACWGVGAGVRNGFHGGARRIAQKPRSMKKASRFRGRLNRFGGGCSYFAG